MAEVHQFSLDLAAFADKAKGRVDDVVRQVALGVFKGVVLRTPVRTGRARANWTLTIGTPSAITRAVVDATGAKTIAEAQQALAAWRSINGGGLARIWITNSLPYILRLEHGWSDRAPNGMVAVTVAEFNRYIAQAIKEA